MEKVEQVPIPTADKPAAHNSTEKDSWGHGAANDAPKLTQEASFGKGRVKD